jgi:hypothetical protein
VEPYGVTPGEPGVIWVIRGESWANPGVAGGIMWVNVALFKARADRIG